MEARAEMEEGSMEDEMAEQEELESRVSGYRGLGSLALSPKTFPALQMSIS